MKRRLALGALSAILIWGSFGTLLSAAGRGRGTNPGGSAPGVERLGSGLRERIAASRPDELLRVIVQTKSRPADLDHVVARTAGGVTGANFHSTNAFPARIRAARVASLLGNPRIERVSLDWTVAAAIDSAAPYARAPQVWQDFGLTGDGVTVAVIDSGLDESADVRSDNGRSVLHVDMLGSGGLPINPLSNDGFGHGTHVAGIIGGTGELSSGPGATRTFHGIAPRADIISLRALDAAGMGTTSDIIRAVDWVIAHKDSHNIRVLNLSLGHPIDESYATDPLCQAVGRAWDQGIVVVVSAGNYGDFGYGTILSPANHPKVITVGAGNDRNTLSFADDAVGSFSSMGPTSIDGIIKPDILASGVQVASQRAAGSTIDVTYPVTRIPLSFHRSGLALGSPVYAAYSGTSMAAPAVAGAAALMIAAEPGLGPDTVKARLMASARPVNADAVRRGAGMLDIRAAIARTDITVAPGLALSPRVVTTVAADGTEEVAIVDPQGLYPEPIDATIEGQIAIWGGFSAWGQIAIWGRSNSAQIAIWGMRAQSGDSVIAATE